MRAALYLRVSTDRQDVENQRLAIEERRHLEGIAARQDYEVVTVYEDIYSGAKDRGRVGFQEMLHDAARGRWDVLIFYAMDRLTRKGPRAAFAILSELQTAGVGWVSVNEPFLNSDQPEPLRELLLSIVSWWNREERRIISERTKAALARRLALGHHIGRAPGAKDLQARTILGTCGICGREKYIYRRTRRCRKCAIRENRRKKRGSP